jgi:hypothetical protein
MVQWGWCHLFNQYAGKTLASDSCVFGAVICAIKLKNTNTAPIYRYNLPSVQAYSLRTDTSSYVHHFTGLNIQLKNTMDSDAGIRAMNIAKSIDSAYGVETFF